ncbi:MAG: prephenate dehydrogenase/arogenate dehydrogenase family protein [Armatimonadetes bacterium]|nr:prephenate dehydrogenase/arogenate dehydrogenase family protein [Armatimonadota bacterium]
MRIGIVGTGLIGASVGMALKTQGHQVFGLDTNSEHISTALRRNAIDQAADLAEISQLDVVFMCISPSLLVPIAEEAYAQRGELTIFTDCGSTKTEVAAWAKDKPMFVPGHPMAGHEKSGPAYATNWLFRGAKWILTPNAQTDKHAVSVIEGLVKEMEATPVCIPPDTHDQQVGILSHLPHVVAALLIESRNSVPKADVSGGSWKDLTRVAGVDPGLWTDILMSNRQELVKVLADFSSNLSGVQEMLEQGDREALNSWLRDIVKWKAKQNES